MTTLTSLSAVTLREAILPLVPTFRPEDLRTTKVENRWTPQNQNERYAKMYLPVCDDPSHKEVFLYVIDQFLDAAHNDRLHLSTGPVRYTKFRDVLGGDLRIVWQQISDAQAAKSIDTFATDLDDLIGRYLAPTSYFDQLEYLRSATKPYNQTCEELASRLRVMSRLGQYLPGSRLVPAGGRSELILTDDALKRTFFNLMPMQWKIKFAESGQVLTGNTYTYQNLVRFMSVQEALSKRGSDGKRKAQGPPSGGRGYGGRGSGSGGRGSGRGGRGYGRGRGNRGNYQYRNYGQNYQPYGQGGVAYGVYPTTNPAPYVPRAPSTPRGGGRGPPAAAGRTRSVSFSPGRAPVPTNQGPFFRNTNPWGYQQRTTQQYHSEHYYQEPEDPNYAAEQYHVEEPYTEAQDHYYEESNGHDYGQEYNEQYQAEAAEHEPEQEEQTEVHWLDDFNA